MSSSLDSGKELFSSSLTATEKIRNPVINETILTVIFQGRAFVVKVEWKSETGKAQFPIKPSFKNLTAVRGEETRRQ